MDGGTVSLMVNYYPAKTEGIASALVKQNITVKEKIDGVEEAGRNGESLVFRIGKDVHKVTFISENRETYEKEYVSLALQRGS